MTAPSCSFGGGFARAMPAARLFLWQSGVLRTVQRLAQGLKEEFLIRLYFRRNNTSLSTLSRAVVIAAVVIIARIECEKESRDSIGKGPKTALQLEWSMRGNRYSQAQERFLHSSEL